MEKIKKIISKKIEVALFFDKELKNITINSPKNQAILIKQINQFFQYYRKFSLDQANLNHNFQRMLYFTITQNIFHLCFFNTQPHHQQFPKMLPLVQYFLKLKTYIKYITSRRLKKQDCLKIIQSFQDTFMGLVHKNNTVLTKNPQTGNIEKKKINLDNLIEISQIITPQIDEVMILIIKTIQKKILKQNIFFNFFQGQNQNNQINHTQQNAKKIIQLLLGDKFKQDEFGFYKIKMNGDIRNQNNMQKKKQTGIFIGSFKKICFCFYRKKQINKKQSSRIAKSQIYQIPSITSIPTNQNQFIKTQITQKSVIVKPPYESKLSESTVSISNIKQNTKFQSLTKSNLIVQNTQYCQICQEKPHSIENLIYNYKIYCKGCIISPQTSLESIPNYILQNFLKKYNLIQPFQFPLYCPTCYTSTMISKYTPLNKPSHHYCLQCRNPICLKHNIISYFCFCVCPSCQIQTYYNIQLNIKICLKCKKTRCQNCGDSKCQCRCLNCYTPKAVNTKNSQLKNSKIIDIKQNNYKCNCFKQKQCHYCYLVNNFMIECTCGGTVCRPCSFNRITKTSNGIYKIQCDNLQ